MKTPEQILEWIRYCQCDYGYFNVKDSLDVKHEVLIVLDKLKRFIAEEEENG